MRLAFESLFNQGYMGGENWLDGILYALAAQPNPTECLVVGASEADLPPYTGAIPGVRAVPYPSRLGWRLGAAAERRVKRLVSPAAEDPALRWVADHHPVDLWVSLTSYEGLDRARPTLICWPDFQHRHYPENFDQREIQSREATWKRVSQEAAAVVTLTEAVRRDALAPFGNSNQVVDPGRLFVCPAPPAIRPDMLRVDGSAVPRELRATGPYFVVSNQFWKHKNHGLVLTALDHLRKSRELPLVFFTGQRDDQRNSRCFQEVQAFAVNLGVHAVCRFVGVIPRAAQVSLIRGATGVIQPSRFEGQGAIVDESLALGTRLLCSDLPPHHERAADYPDGSVEFFDVDDAERLASLMGQALDAPREPRTDDEIISVVHGRARATGHRFSEICRQVIEHHESRRAG